MREPRQTCSGLTSSDDGTITPLIVLCFLLAGTFIAASVAASGAFLAQRDLAGACDGAAIAAANAFSRPDPATQVADPAGGQAMPGEPDHLGEGAATADFLPLSPQSVEQAVADYGQQLRSTGGAPLSLTASTDGHVVTVVCQRTVHVPFGALLGYGDGLDRTVVARARSPLG